MTAVRHLAALLLLASAPAWPLDCPCDPAKPETMPLRQCGLCRVAESQPPDVPYFFLKDNNPRKPNRWLLLPRQHGPENHPLAAMDPKFRTELWKAAIAKGKELWGDDWGVAYNGDKVRTQCHAHIHIGKLLKGIDTGKFVVVGDASQIPLKPGEGVWVHPMGKRLHVHVGEQTTETVLLR